MEDISSTPNNQNCRNCNRLLLNHANYCSSCGQKNTDGRISISSFFSAFFSTVFNLDSKFFQTMRHILIPGKLTLEYFKGRHKRYFHPVRLFIVSALLLIAAIGSQLNTGISMHNIQEKVEKQVRKEKFLASVDLATQQTLEKFPAEASLRPAFDTLYKNLKGKNSDYKDSVDLNKAIITQGIDNLDFRISNEDFLDFGPEELVAKYKVENRLDRFMFKQKIKLLKEEGSFAPFVLGNSLWIILLMMPFLALILKVLYAKQSYYYVEHLVFSFHTHSFAFLLFALLGFIIISTNYTWLIPIGFLSMFIYLFLALRKVYRQGKFITFVKLLVINVSYLFLFFSFFVFGLLASMAIF